MEESEIGDMDDLLEDLDRDEKLRDNLPERRRR